MKKQKTIYYNDYDDYSTYDDNEKPFIAEDATALFDELEMIARKRHAFFFDRIKLMLK
jgi:hypothetical protein